MTKVDKIKQLKSWLRTQSMIKLSMAEQQLDCTPGLF